MKTGDAPVIVDALAAPGHDGAAVLVVRVRHENGVVDAVTLDARAADFADRIASMTGKDGTAEVAASVQRLFTGTTLVLPGA